jgi:hypothetical protein
MLNFRWANCNADFTMPVDVQIGEKKLRINPSSKWAKLPVDQIAELSIDPDYYIGSLKIR